MITYQQLIDLLLSAILVGHIVLDAHQRGGPAVVAATDHRDGCLIVSAFRLLFRPAAHVQLGRVALAVTDVEDNAARLLQVVFKK